MTRPTDPLGAFVVGPELLRAGTPGGRLEGVRFAVKDLFDVAGERTGAGNPDWLADAAVASADATAVTALLEAGADLWGKTVTDELAFSLGGTNVHYGTPVNPAAPGRAPGGSSSGSASAVAGGVVDVALGTDTGGSIRVPASYCGIWGLRPTHGRLSEAGLVPLAPSFDTVGVLAGRAGRLADTFYALRDGAGTGPGHPDARRPGSIRRLVVAGDLFELADPDARVALTRAVVDLAAGLGLEVGEADLAGRDELVAVRDGFRAIQLVEAWQSDGPWITRRRPTFGPDVAGRFDLARDADPAAGRRAEPIRDEIRRAIERLGGPDGLVVQPATCGPAYPLDLDDEAKEDLRARTLTLTAPAGMAGAPVVAAPLASVDGLPIGLALVGCPGEDELLVDLARRAEAAVG